MNAPGRRIGCFARLLGATVLLAGCGPLTPPVAQTPPPPVTVSQPIVREVVNQDDYEGRITAAQTVEVRSRVRGHLTKVLFQPGQMVKEGEQLYEIDPRPYQAVLDGAKAQLASAEASHKLARAELTRVTSLAAKGAATREEVDTLTAKLTTTLADKQKAEAAIEQAQLDLDFCQIKAPLTGKISRTLVDKGNLVNAGSSETLLTTIVSVDPIYVYFNVDERALLQFLRETPATKRKDAQLPGVHELKIPVFVALEDEKDHPHKGVIDFADNRVNPSTGTIQVRGVLANADQLLADGMRARVRVPAGDPHKTLLVTERAIGTNQGRKFVYVVNAQNVVAQRDITLGRVFDGLQAIQEGIKPDDWIIVNGTQRVREGMTVQPQRGPMPGTK